MAEPALRIELLPTNLVTAPCSCGARHAASAPAGWEDVGRTIAKLRVLECQAEREGETDGEV